MASKGKIEHTCLHASVQCAHRLPREPLALGTYPDYLWATIKSLVQEFDNAFPVPGSEAELLFLGRLLDNHSWAPGAELLRQAVNEDPTLIRRLLNQTASPPAADAQASVARFWFYPGTA